MNREFAEILALKALTFVVSDDTARDTFMTQSGLDGAEMRAAAASADFQAGLLDFLGRNEALLRDFCETAEIEPDDVALASRALMPNGAQGEWNST